MTDRFTMLYCDGKACYVNTFEYGDDGECPGCGAEGIPLGGDRS